MRTIENSDAVLPLSGVRVAQVGDAPHLALLAGLLAGAGATVERSTAATSESETSSLAAADVIVIDRSGEGHAHTPSVGARSAIVVDLTPRDLPGSGPLTTEASAQLASGLVWEHVPGSPRFMNAQLATFGAALLGAVGTAAALLRRHRDGTGSHVRTDLLSGAMTFASLYRSRFDGPDAPASNRRPRSRRWPMWRCRDGAYVFVSPGSRDAVASIHRACERLVGERIAGERDDAEIDFEFVDRAATMIDSTDLLGELQQRGVAAAIVAHVDTVLGDAQVLANQIITSVDGEDVRVGCPVSWVTSSARR